MEDEYGTTVSQIRLSTMVKPFGTKTSWYSLCCRWHLTGYKHAAPYGTIDVGVGVNNRDPFIFVNTGIHLTKIYSVFVAVSNDGVDIKWNIKLCKGLEVGIVYSNFNIIKPVATFQFVPNELLRCKRACESQPAQCLDLVSWLLQSSIYVNVAWDADTAPYIGFGLHL